MVVDGAHGAGCALFKAQAKEDLELISERAVPVEEVVFTLTSRSITVVIHVRDKVVLGRLQAKVIVASVDNLNAFHCCSRTVGWIIKRYRNLV